MRKVGVTGGRTFEDAAHVWGALDRSHAEAPIDRLIQGGAAGADALARAWGHRNHVQVVTYEYRRGMGRAGGPARNAAMMADGLDELIVFPGGTGTEGCREVAEAKGIKINDQSKSG